MHATVGRMATRRHFLGFCLAGLLPNAAAAQDAPALRIVLDSLMRRHRVPGVGMAVVRNGEIAELVSRGVVRAGATRPIGTGTLFQAASISKVVAGLVVLRLVERNALQLDAPIVERLRGWRLPAGQPTWAEAVTPRLLLCHRAGINVPGFEGYVPGARLPTLDQTLDGVPPANSAAVKVAWPPGGAFRYSGGGTTILQHLVQDVTASTFEALAANVVLGPAKMSRSTFRQPLPATELDGAVAHDVRGRPLPGRWRIYPEHAAAGLWSTPADLAPLALAIAASQPLARQMGSPVDGGPTGLGVFVQRRRDRPPWLYHYGDNAGFHSVLAFAADASFGVALMTNGDGGEPLIAAFLDALFDANGLDRLKPPD